MPKKAYTPEQIINKLREAEVGQHTEEILLDNGYTWEDIAQLKDEGVFI